MHGRGAQSHAALCTREDGAGHKGVYLDSVGTRESAAETIAIALRSLGPHVLPWSEMVRPQPYPGLANTLELPCMCGPADPARATKCCARMRAGERPQGCAVLICYIKCHEASARPLGCYCYALTACRVCWCVHRRVSDPCHERASGEGGA